MTRVARGRISPPPSAPVWPQLRVCRYYILLAGELDVRAYNAWGRPRLRMLRLTLGHPSNTRSLLDGVVALELLDQFNDVYELNDGPSYLVSTVPHGELMRRDGPRQLTSCGDGSVRVPVNAHRKRPRRSTSRSSRAFTILEALGDLKIRYSARSPRWFLIWGRAARRGRLRF